MAGTGEGTTFIQLFLKASGCSFEADPRGHMMRCYWHPLAFISRHQLSPHGTAHNCAPHGSVARGLTHTQENIFYQNFSCQQASCLKAHGLLTSCLWLPSPVSHAPCSHWPLFRVVPFTCTSWAWSSQALRVPIAAHPCPGTGFSHPPHQEHKQVPAVFIHTEWCMILCRKCVCEPHKSSTTSE